MGTYNLLVTFIRRQLLLKDTKDHSWIGSESMWNLLPQ